MIEAPTLARTYLKLYTIRKLPVIPAGAFSIIQDGVQDGRQNVETAISRLVINIT